MVPAGYSYFFEAGASVAGALIGLLFVAISVVPHKLAGEAASPEFQVKAGLALSALLDAMLLCLYGLLPGRNLAIVGLVVALWGLGVTVGVGRRQLRRNAINARTGGTEASGENGPLRALAMFALATVFVLQLLNSVVYVFSPHSQGCVSWDSTLIIVCFLFAITRAGSDPRRASWRCSSRTGIGSGPSPPLVTRPCRREVPILRPRTRRRRATAADTGATGEQNGSVAFDRNGSAPSGLAASPLELITDVTVSRYAVYARRFRVQARLVALALIAAIIATQHPHPGWHGRSLVILITLVLAIFAGAAALLVPKRMATTRIAVEALACGILVGYDPGTASVLLIFVGLDAAESLPPATAGYFTAMAVVAVVLATVAASNSASDAAYGLVAVGGFLLGTTIRQAALRAEQAELRLADMERAEIERSKAAHLAQRADAARRSTTFSPTISAP